MGFVAFRSRAFPRVMLMVGAMCVLNARGRVCDNQLEFDLEISAVSRTVNFFWRIWRSFQVVFCWVLVDVLVVEE